MSAFLLMLDPENGGLTQVQVGATLLGANTSVTTDQLFVTDETGFAEFAGSPGNLSYQWHSGDRYYPKPVNFGSGIVDAEGSATMEIYADNELRTTVAVQGYTSFRLPSGSPAYIWSVRINGAGVVREIKLASSFQEIKHG